MNSCIIYHCCTIQINLIRRNFTKGDGLKLEGENDCHEDMKRQIANYKIQMTPCTYVYPSDTRGVLFSTYSSICIQWDLHWTQFAPAKTKWLPQLPFCLYIACQKTLIRPLCSLNLYVLFLCSSSGDFVCNRQLPCVLSKCETFSIFQQLYSLKMLELNDTTTNIRHF